MNDNNVVIYQDDNGITRVSVRFSEEDFWAYAGTNYRALSDK